MSGFNTSRDPWIVLENNFTSKSDAKVAQVFEELQHLKKCNQTTFEYIIKIKMLLNQLLTVGCLVKKEQ